MSPGYALTMALRGQTPAPDRAAAPDPVVRRAVPGLRGRPPSRHLRPGRPGLRRPDRGQRPVRPRGWMPCDGRSASSVHGHGGERPRLARAPDPVRDGADRHGGALGRPGLAGGRAGAAAGAHHHRSRPADLGDEPERPSGPARPGRRAQGTRRHLRRAARAAGSIVPGPAPVHCQRLARTAHPAGPAAGHQPGRPGRSGRHRGIAAHRARAGPGRRGRAAASHRRAADLGQGTGRPA